MSILRFEPNVPLEVALKFDEGRHVQSRIAGAPDQVQYSICGGDTIYVPLDVETKIKALGVKKEELISICKTQRDKLTRWTVTRVSDAQEPPTRWEHNLQASVDEANAQRTVTPSKSTSAAHATTAPPAVGGLPHVEQPNHNAPVMSVASKLVASALIAVIDGVLVAMDYGKSKGLKVSLDLDFNAEDLRALAATTLINFAKGQPYPAPEPKVNGHANGGTSWPQQ